MCEPSPSPAGSHELIESELATFVSGLGELSVITRRGYRRGARELLLFLAREGLCVSRLSADDARRFLRETLGRGPWGSGEITRAKAHAIIEGSKRYLRAKGAADEVVRALFCRGFWKAGKYLVTADPSRAAILREVASFAATLIKAPHAKRSACRSGALELLTHLAEKGRALEDVTHADWRSFRVRLIARAGRTKHAQAKISGARAFLRFKVSRGELRPEQVFPSARHDREAPVFPERLALLPEKLEEAMELSTLAANTRPPYRRALRDLLVWLNEQGITNLSEVTRDVMVGYRLHLQSRPNEHGMPLALTTQLGALAGLRFFFSWLVKLGVLLVDPLVHLPNPRAPQRLPRVLRIGEAAHLLRSLPETEVGLRDKALLELLYGTGMRRAELAALELGDVDLAQGTILIRQGKGGKDRVVPLGKKAKETLLDYLDHVRAKWAHGESDAVFLAKDGRPLTPGYVTLRVKKLGRRVGIEVRPHILRHTCATHLLKGHADIRHIQRLLGHKSLSTTERYTRVEVSDLRKVIRRCHPRERM